MWGIFVAQPAAMTSVINSCQEVTTIQFNALKRRRCTREQLTTRAYWHFQTVTFYVLDINQVV